ncbi:unnamed protein product [Blepharisma stoltei]|uniref:Protein kinase domain-containing protein n=1 Tax=Blepharisma stoltei TaxID=1481888 RepID=A0AAU9JST0_9CILI|nr:unnamed protein product [Blepharisma stoltei]
MVEDANGTNLQNSAKRHCIIDSEDGLIINPQLALTKQIYKSFGSATTVELYNDTIIDTPVIIKRLDKKLLFTEAQNESAKRELEIHRSLNHPNIVQLYDGCETNDEFLFVMEYIPRHDYFTEKIEVNNRPFNSKSDGGIDKLKSFTYDILKGLEYLHDNHIIHLDLKPANLMVKPVTQSNEYPLVKIGDFGLSRRFGEEGGVIIDQKCGTDKYIPPEVRSGAWITPAVDMWCFGLILHTLTVGFAPYVLKWNPGQEIPFNPRWWKKYKDTGLTDLISSCLKLDPAERITAKEALNHKWFDCRLG